MHIGPDVRSDSDSDDGGWDSDGFSLTYSEPHASDDELYEHSRGYLFGDYNYPCIDVSGEIARRTMWDEEERILRDQRAGYFSPTRNLRGGLSREGKGYGATVSDTPFAKSGGSGPSPMFKGKKAWNRYSLGDDGLLDEEQIKGATIIDMESDRIPEMVVAGVKMKWTKQNKLVPVHQPEGSSSSKPPPDRGKGYGSPLSVSLRSDPSSPSRHRPQGLPLHAAKPLLPHDAVDLVVEDPDASAERITKERRKGEPSVHGQAGDFRTLRRVYRPGYEAQDKEGEGAILGATEEMGLVDDSEGSDERDEPPEKMDVKIVKESEVDPDENNQLHGEALTVEMTDATVARATTPPLHARVDFTQYTPEDDNPWI